jgi:NSS family neurotransmitter:Na+ symporter
MAAIGSAIGLGNVWRFPAICYSYGKGTFLIPWLIGLIVLGIPWFLVELGMGHWMQSGAPGSFAKIGKKWEWAGWWPVFTSFFLNAYYVIIMAWSVCYIGYSLFLSWEAGAGPLAERVPSFFYDSFLGLTSGPGVLGGLNLLVIGALALCWLAIFLILYKGVRRVGKIVMYTVTIPWALLVILMIRGLTLPGAIEGLNAFLTPDLYALGDISIWIAAFGQIAFTLSLGMGIMFAYGSYIPKKSDVTNNALITSFANCGTSFLAGFAVFSTLGYMAQSLGISVAKIPNVGGLGLAFQTYPTAISLMPFAQQIIGLIFFLCLWTLGIDSAFSISEAMITGIIDKWKISKPKATGIVCSLGFLVGLIFTTGAGLYWLDMVDRSVSFFGLVLTGTVALLIIGWVFGAEKLREHINAVSDIKIGKWFDWLVKVVAPALALFAIIPQFIAESVGKEVLGIKLTESILGYPLWAELIGFWGFLIMPIALALIFGFILKGKK